MYRRRMVRRQRRKKTESISKHPEVAFSRFVRVYEVEKTEYSDEDESDFEYDCSVGGGMGHHNSDAGLNLEERLDKRLRILDEADEEMEDKSDDRSLKRTSSGRLDWIRRSFSKKKERERAAKIEVNDGVVMACGQSTQTAVSAFAALNNIANPHRTLTGANNCDCNWFNAARRYRLRKSVFRMQQQYFEFYVRTRIFTRPPDAVVQYLLRFKLLRTLIERVDRQENGEIPKTGSCYCRQIARIYSEYCRLFKEITEMKFEVKQEELPPTLKLFY
ncbi:hypothetical protein AB6A40_003328 [Gnathostoma spinigerum]|uniref:Uncharacterized protein n=1 Tax=Gnathostoma spinigerum TaxID=75299 RepID=A0ABD6E991_9BILA